MEESVEVPTSTRVYNASELRDLQQQSLEFVDYFVLHSVWRLVQFCLRLLRPSNAVDKDEVELGSLDEFVAETVQQHAEVAHGPVLKMLQPDGLAIQCLSLDFLVNAIC